MQLNTIVIFFSGMISSEEIHHKKTQPRCGSPDTTFLWGLSLHPYKGQDKSQARGGERKSCDMHKVYYIQYTKGRKTGHRAGTCMPAARPPNY